MKIEEIERKYNTKAKSILFNTEMVKAILDGRKTQTRRLLGCKIIKKDNAANSLNGVVYTAENRDLYFEHNLISEFSKYNLGDILYVRESFVRGKYDADCLGSPIVTFYKADGDIDWVNSDLEDVNTPWKPPIYMPKEYARIFLKVTSVRVEKLCDISYTDLIKEGIECDWNKGKHDRENELLENFFNKIVKENFDPRNNYYVFVYEFEVIKE